MRDYDEIKGSSLQDVFNAAKSAWEHLDFSKDIFYDDRENPRCACFIGAAAIGLDTNATLVGCILQQQDLVLGEFIRINDLCETKEQVLDKVAQRFGLVR